MATDEKTRVDAEKTKEIRQLLAEGGDAAVQHKFGEDVTASAEYQKAQKQREAARKRQATTRRNAAGKETQVTKPAAGPATKQAGRTPKAREQTLERRRQLKEQEKSKDTLSR